MLQSDILRQARRFAASVGMRPTPVAPMTPSFHSRAAACMHIADSSVARHGVLESSRTQCPALDELWTVQQTHRARAADCPRDSEVPRQEHLHQACRANARSRRVHCRRSGTALKPRCRARTSPGRGGLAGRLPEVLAQVRLVGEAAPQRDVAQGRIGRQHVLSGQFHAPSHDKSVR